MRPLIATRTELKEKLEKAFEAGKHRGIYEVVELNYTYGFDSTKPPPDKEAAVKQIIEGKNDR